MANIVEVVNYDTAIYQIATTDPVVGGPGGIANMAAQSLANRTAWLKQQIAAAQTSIAGLASINGQQFTGTPTLQADPPIGDSSAALTDTRWTGVTIFGGVTVNIGGSSSTALLQSQYGCNQITLTGALTGNTQVVFPTKYGKWGVTNATTGNFSVSLKTAADATGFTIQQGSRAEVICNGVNLLPAQTDLTQMLPTAGLSASSCAQLLGKGGLVIQAGTAIVPATGLVSIVYPEPFPNAVVAVVANEANTAGWSPTGGQNQPTTTVYGTQNQTTSGFNCVCTRNNGQGAWQYSGGSVMWMAMGF